MITYLLYRGFLYKWRIFIWMYKVYVHQMVEAQGQAKTDLEISLESPQEQAKTTVFN
jgi:hypothetical protein